MKKKTLLTMMTLLSISAFAENRIKEEQDPNTRCQNNVPASKCSSLQKQALNLHCITQEEYNSLVAFGSFPSCSPDPEIPGQFILLSWCRCGCFHPDTNIYAVSAKDNFIDSFVKASEIVANKSNYMLSNLNTSSTIEHPVLNWAPIRVVTEGAEKFPLVVIETTSGSTLKVTSKHAILKSDGSMVQAKYLVKGDDLVTPDGVLVGIEAISMEKFGGNVVNFAVEAKEPIEHIIIAEKILVGDLLWQSSLDDLQNQVTVRK